MQEAAFIALSINQDGQVFVGDQLAQGDALSQALTKAAEHNPDTEVQLRADTRVPYGRVVDVMGIAHKAGLYRIGFVAESATEQPR